MYKGTTPTFKFNINEDAHIDDATNVYVTFSTTPNYIKAFLTKTGTDLSIVENSIHVYLTQQETLDFPSSKIVYVQANWLYANGTRACTKPKEISVGENFINRVLP